MQRLGHKGLGRTSKSTFETLRCAEQSSGVTCSPGESNYENLELELAKSLNPNRIEVTVPEYRRGVKDPNTTQWRHGPVSHTAMSIKQFFID